MTTAIRLFMAAALVMLPMTGIHAITGTMQRLDAKMQYTINGGTVTSKKVARIEEQYDGTSSYNQKKIKVYEANITGTVLKGGTLTVSCKKLAGITLPNETAPKVIVEYDYVYDGFSTFNEHKKIENAKEATVSIPIDKDYIKEVRVRCTYLSPHNKMVCYSVWTVGKKENTTTPNTPNESTSVNPAKTFKDQATCEGHTMKYSISGGKILKKEKADISHDNFGHDNYRQSIKGIVQPGATISVDLSKVDGEGTPRLGIVFDYVKKGQMPSLMGIMYQTEQKNSTSKSFRVPSDAESVEIHIHYQVPHKGTDSDIDISARLYVGDSMPDYEYSSSTPSTSVNTNTPGNFRWDDKYEDKCEICDGKFSGYFISGLKGNFIQRCGTITTEENIQHYFEPRPNELYDPIFVKDQISTLDHDVVKVQWGNDEGSSITIGPNSQIRYEGLVNGKPRWKVHYGTIVGQRLKKIEQKKPSFSLSNCLVELLGTSYVIQDNGKTSAVYLLDGSIKVTNNKKKSYTLKPGQSSTIGKDGKIVVKTFDVNAMAKKYGITLNGTGNTGLVFTADNLHYKILSDKTVELTGDLRGNYKGHVTIPNQVKHSGKTYQVVGIGQNTFADQTGLTSITIPKSIRGIAADAFRNTGLTEVVIPGDDVNINQYAFRNCKKLTVVTANGKKPNCSASAFEGCTSMKELRIHGISESNNGKKLSGTNAVIKVIK